MREIKFRAWDKENKEMLEIEDLHWDDCTREFLIRTTMYRDYFTPEEMILMQYTGLHDKNEKEIYEGDILLRKSGSFESLILVKWGRVEFSFLCAPLYNGKLPKKFNWTRSTYQGLDGYAEVIGNIYENPELLERSSNED